MCFHDRILQDDLRGCIQTGIDHSDGSGKNRHDTFAEPDKDRKKPMKMDLLDKQAFQGRVEWIGIARESRGEIHSLNTAVLVAGQGIQDEHHFGRRPLRQVTLIQHEHIAVVAALLGRETLPPELLRRNIVVSGINLASLIGRKFVIGNAVLEGTNDCPPCSRMEENLGTGGYEAMVAHGGITASVIQGSEISLTDQITAQTLNICT